MQRDMATTVEARAREQVRAAAPKAPWYRDRIRLGLAAGVAVLVLGLLAWFIVTSGRRKEEFAQRSLNQARTAAEAGNLPLASSELQKVIQTYKGTDAATEAMLTLNQVRMVNGQSELAVVGLRDFLKTESRGEVSGAGQRPPRARPWRTRPTSPRPGRPIKRRRRPPRWSTSRHGI